MEDIHLSPADGRNDYTKTTVISERRGRVEELFKSSGICIFLLAKATLLCSAHCSRNLAEMVISVCVTVCIRVCV